MRPGLAIFGVVLIAVGLFIGFGWLSSSVGTANAQVRDRVSTVQIDNDSGNVSVRVGERPSVKQTFHYRFSEPEDSYTVEDGRLVLGDCGWWCSVDYEVVVPPGTSVTGDANSGSVQLTGVGSADIDVNSGTTTVRDVRGDVSVDGNSGDVNLERIGGTVSVDAASGSVRGTGLSGATTVDASSGDVELTMGRPNDVAVDASSGDVRLRLPDGDYDIDADASSGDERVDVPNVPGAANTVEAHASSGDVLVTPA